MRNRGIGRGRMFMGGVLITAAAAVWAIGLMMSPHEAGVAEGVDHVRGVVVTFVRNSAIGTLMLCALSAWLLFPNPRPKKPRRDYALMGLLGVMAVTSLYQLYWVTTLS